MGHKLLLADDSITIQKVVGIIFSNDEFDLTVVDNGNAAVEKAREIRPDAMLVDALMPGKNGYDVCREIRSDAALSSVPILLLTGVFEPFDENKARESGADDFIAKPFESQQLIEKVKKLLAEGSTSAAPVQAVQPAAAPRPVEPAPAVAAAPAIEEFVFAEEESAAGEPVWGAGDVVVANAEDDLWGTVEEGIPMEAEPAAAAEEAFAFDEPQAAGIPADTFAFDEPAPVAAAPSEITDPFSFDAPVAGEPLTADPFEFDEPAAAPAPALSADPFAFDEPAAAPVADDAFAFDESAAVPVADDAFAFDEPGEEITLGVPEEAPAAAADPFAFDDISLPEPVAPAIAVPADTNAFEESVFELEEGPVETEIELTPSLEPVAPAVAAPVVQPVSVTEEPRVAPSIAPPPVAATAAAAAAIAGEITEEQLVAALSKVSREIIEKIVWEVVPDLAETMIRQELAKIRGAK